MIHAFLFFSSHFFLHLLSGSHLFLKDILLFLLFCLLLLVTNQILDHGGFGYVLVALVVEELFLLHFLLLGVVHILLYFFAMSSFIVYDFLFLLLFLCLV